MLSVVLPKILAVDRVKRISQTSWRWTMLSVVLPAILAVDQAKRASPRDPGGGPC